MYTLEFRNFGEVRMGSPYNVADVELTGNFVPKLGGRTFQDKGAVSADGSTCYLVEWKTLNGNSPGFQVWKISETARSVSKSEVFTGCCEAIKQLEDGAQVIIAEQPNPISLLSHDFKYQ